MNTNPIKAKLEKMFGKTRRNKVKQLSMPSTIMQSRISSQLNLSVSSIAQSSTPNSNYHPYQYTSQSQPNEFKYTHPAAILLTSSDTNKENNDNPNNFNIAMSQLQSMKTELNHYKALSKKLTQKLQDHELLEQFYLQQLKQRNQVQRQLKWKLDVLGEQIRNKRVTLGVVDGVDGIRKSNLGEADRGVSVGY